MSESCQHRVVCWFSLLSVLALTGGPLRAQPVLHFEEDFEADKGYAVGQHMGGVNGWTAFPGSFATAIGENEPGLDGMFGDGKNHIRLPENRTKDTGIINDANIKDGLDEDRIYTLEWDWKIWDLANGHTHNSDMGFRCWNGIIGAYAEGASPGGAPAIRFLSVYPPY